MSVDDVTGEPPPATCASSTPDTLAGGGVELAAADREWAEYVAFSGHAWRASRVLLDDTVPLTLRRFHALVDGGCPVPPLWGVEGMTMAYKKALAAVLDELDLNRRSTVTAPSVSEFCEIYEARPDPAAVPAECASPDDAEHQAWVERIALEIERNAHHCDCSIGSCACTDDRLCYPDDGCKCECCLELQVQLDADTTVEFVLDAVLANAKPGELRLAAKFVEADDASLVNELWWIDLHGAARATYEPTAPLDEAALEWDLRTGDPDSDVVPVLPPGALDHPVLVPHAPIDPSELVDVRERKFRRFEEFGAALKLVSPERRQEVVRGLMATARKRERAEATAVIAAPPVSAPPGALADRVQFRQQQEHQSWVNHYRMNFPQPIDWSTVDQPTDPKWIIEGFIQEEEHVHLSAQAKVGKSLLVLEIAANASIGRDSFTGLPIDPLTVVYLDYEMTPREIVKRLGLMGIDHRAFDRLHYMPHPGSPMFDTERAKAWTEVLIEKHHPHLVIIDTLARVVEGDENDSSSYHNFYKFVGSTLKQHGVALIRIDHEGHKAGVARGSTAKASDVDASWSVSKANSAKNERGLKLTLLSDRSGEADETITLMPHDPAAPLSLRRRGPRRRRGDQSAISLTANAAPVQTIDPKIITLIDRLNRLGVPLDAPHTEANKILKTDGKGIHKSTYYKAKEQRIAAATGGSRGDG